VTVGNCSDGTVLLNLAVDGVFGATTGPVAVATSSTLTFDRKKPVFTITPPVTPNNATTLAFSVTSDESVTGITASAFTVSGTSCVIGTVSGSAATYTVNVTGCSSTSTAALTLKANIASDPATNTGPAAAITSSGVTVDRVVPAVVSIVKSTTSRSDLIVYELTMSESVTGMDSAGADFTIAGTGCKITKLTGSGTSYSIWVTDCADGAKASITLKANSLVDTAGNLGPAADTVSPEVQIDDQLPRVTITTDARAAQTASPTFTLTYSEAVTGVTLDSFSWGGTAKGCKFALTEVTSGLVYKVVATTCGAGTVKLLIPGGSAKDANGNLGPMLPVESATVIVDVDPANSAGTAVSRPRRTLSGYSRGAGLLRAASVFAPRMFNYSDVGAVVALGASLGLLTRRGSTRK
jgi:hypothetical protein